MASTNLAQNSRNQRRRSLLRRAAMAVLTSNAALAFWSCFGERHYPRVRRVSVPLTTLPKELHGFTICHVSDLHRGPLVAEDYLHQALATANSLRADLIAVTGDHVSASWQYAESCAAVLSRLSAPYGIFAVPGNHDTFGDSTLRVCKSLADAGISVLVNRSVHLPIGGAEAWVCGLDDVLRAQPNLEAALAPVPEGAFRILLCHEPDYADTAARHGFPIQLSGHSHGGQVRLPGLPPLLLPRMSQRYPQGLQRVVGTSSYVYTNAGLGVAGLPLRLNCPPEITLLTLSRTRNEAGCSR